MDAGVFLESSLFLFDMVTTVLSVTTPPLYSPAALLGKLLLVILAGVGRLNIFLFKLYETLS